MTVVFFPPLWDFSDGQFYSVMRFQWQLVLFFHKISVMVGFIQLKDFNDCQFSMRSRSRSQWRYVLFFNEILMTVVFFSIRRFQWRSVLFGYEISMTVIFFGVMRFQWQSVLFFHKISVMVGFVRLRDFNDCQFSMRLRLRSQYIMFWSFTTF